jgi:AbrB family looped-hinge helix DNA binding protein
MMIDHEIVSLEGAMATTTISPKFQIVIPKEVRDKLHLTPRQRLQVLEKGGVITLVPEVPLKSLRGLLKGMSKSDLREKNDRL